MKRIGYLEETEGPRQGKKQALGALAWRREGMEEQAGPEGMTAQMRQTLARKLAAFSPETQRLCAEYMAANRA